MRKKIEKPIFRYSNVPIIRTDPIIRPVWNFFVYLLSEKKGNAKTGDLKSTQN